MAPPPFVDAARASLGQAPEKEYGRDGAGQGRGRAGGRAGKVVGGRRMKRGQAASGGLQGAPNFRLARRSEPRRSGMAPSL